MWLHTRFFLNPVFKQLQGLQVYGLDKPEAKNQIEIES